jgi:hypothetical protein
LNGWERADYTDLADILAIVNRLAKVQAISGLGFALFLVLHLATAASGSGGPGAYDGTLGSLRAVYRAHPLVEFLLVGATAAVHMACAVLRILERRRAGFQPKPDLRLRVHRISGYFLMIAFAGHVYATRVMPALGPGEVADYSYLAFSVLAWPAMIIPYYYLLGLAGSIHFGLGLGYALAVLFGARSRMASIAVATGVGILVAAGVTGIVANAGRAERRRFLEFRALYERYMPVMPPADTVTSYRSGPAPRARGAPGEARGLLPLPRPCRGRS